MTASPAQLVSRRTKMDLVLLLGPVIYVFVVGLYYVARYNGSWAESDTSALTHAIRAVSESGRLSPDSGFIYPNGYAYQAIASFLMAATGLEVLQLQQILFPALACLVVLPAWLFYREIIGSAKGAALATILLFTQPEFVFVILRSSHEKFTRSLMLLCLYLLVRSLKVSDRPRLVAVYVGLFYLAAFALIASNSFIAHSFILAIAIAFVAGRVLQRRNEAFKQQSSKTLSRLPYILATSVAGVYLFIFYVYPPAFHQLVVLENVWIQTSSLIFGTDTPASNAYASVATGWSNLYAYFLVSAANWILIATSFSIWAYQGIRWFVLGGTPRSWTDLLVWLLYASFGALGAISVLVDLSGAVGNAQQRLFPSISVFAVAIVTIALVNWRPRRANRSLSIALTALITCFAVLSVFKATNEPLVSNNWIFYRSTEIAAIDWSDEHLTNAQIWTEYDQRMAVAWDMERNGSRRENYVYGGDMPVITRTVMLSDVTRMRSNQLNRELPTRPDAFLIYDNGEAEVYHLRPETPYQR
jgi:hypothetical protein